MSDGLGTDVPRSDRPPFTEYPGAIPEVGAALRGPLRPVRLFCRPVPIRVIAMVPDGPPTWMFYRGREHAIAAAEGPERIETAWWRGPDVRRDYFRVATADGVQFWVFHAPNQEQWYLHGVFA